MGLRRYFGLVPEPIRAVTEIPVVTPLPAPRRVSLWWPGHGPSDLAVGIGDRVSAGENLSAVSGAPFVAPAGGCLQAAWIETRPSERAGLRVLLDPFHEEGHRPVFRPLVAISDEDPEDLRAAIVASGFPVFGNIPTGPSSWPGVETLLVSAVDADPMGMANRSFLRDRPEDIPEAIELLMRASQASRYLLVQGPWPEAGHRILRTLSSMVRITDAYPLGLPEILARRAGKGRLLRVLREGIAGDTWVVGLEHAIGILHCLKRGRPFEEKRLSVQGPGGRDPMLVSARIGTPVGEILEGLGIWTDPGGRVILNGPLRGYACSSAMQGIQADSDTLLVQATGEVVAFGAMRCIRCGRCDAICPVRLEVSRLGRLFESGRAGRARALSPGRCIGCGLCAYVCPARRPLVEMLRRIPGALEEGKAPTVDRGGEVPQAGERP